MRRGAGFACVMCTGFAGALTVRGASAAPGLGAATAGRGVGLTAKSAKALRNSGDDWVRAALATGALAGATTGFGAGLDADLGDGLATASCVFIGAARSSLGALSE